MLDLLGLVNDTRPKNYAMKLKYIEEWISISFSLHSFLVVTKSRRPSIKYPKIGNSATKYGTADFKSTKY